MDSIEQFFSNLNNAWLEHWLDELYNYFHESVIMFSPRCSIPITGVEKMLESYRQFASAATIHSFEVKECSIFTFDSVTMCYLKYEVDNKVNGSRSKEENTEVYCLGSFDSVLKIAWRTQVQLNGENV